MKSSEVAKLNRRGCQSNGNFDGTPDREIMDSQGNIVPRQSGPRFGAETGSCAKKTTFTAGRWTCREAVVSYVARAAWDVWLLRRRAFGSSGQFPRPQTWQVS